MVWEEQIDNNKNRSYTIAAKPSYPPPNSSFSSIKIPQTGVSLIKFNADGTLLATRSDSMPSTVWIWSRDSRSAVACMIHHSPIRSVNWHPTSNDMLLLHCAIDEPIVHLWNASWSSPQILDIRLEKTCGRIEACWIFTAVHESSRLMIGNANNYTTVSLNADGEVLPATTTEETINLGADDRFDEGNSMDLSPIKLSHDCATINLSAESPESSGRWGGSGDLDDTFQFKRLSKLAA